MPVKALFTSLSALRAAAPTAIKAKGSAAAISPPTPTAIDPTALIADPISTKAPAPVAKAGAKDITDEPKLETIPPIWLKLLAPDARPPTKRATPPTALPMPETSPTKPRDSAITPEKKPRARRPPPVKLPPKRPIEREVRSPSPANPRS